VRAAAIAIGVQILAGLVVTPEPTVIWRTTGRSALRTVPPTARLAGAPLVSVWYRGSPVGTPRQQDLAAIRARGFAGVTWPSRQTAGEADVVRMAAALGLTVTLRIDAVPLTAASARTPEHAVDLAVATVRPEQFQALAWRAMAHGAAIVSFDPGVASGTGLDDDAGHPRAWVQPARALAGQVATHAQLIEDWRPASRIAIDPPAPEALDLCLLEDDRSWVLVVTNTARAKVRAVAHLPSGVPAALWLNLLDGSMLSMISQPPGARWSLDLEPAAARVYAVNKGSGLAS
jgi:hypothetical protein